MCIRDRGKVVHTGIIMPEGQIIHASGQVRIDKLDHFGIFNVDQNKYSHKLRVIKRILPISMQPPKVDEKEEENQNQVEMF